MPMNKPRMDADGRGWARTRHACRLRSSAFIRGSRARARLRVGILKFTLMKDDPKTEDMKTISINAELYDQLREYCDTAGIRFKDFVEDALDEAAYREEGFEVLDEVNERIRKIADERKKAYTRGFQRGFLVAFYLAQGNLGTGLYNQAVEKGDLFKSVKGPQLDLFGQ